MIISFSILIELNSSNQLAEAKSLMFGLQWYVQNEVFHLVLESDSTLLVSSALGNCQTPWQFDGTMKKIKNLVIRKKCIFLSNCFKETNMVADKLVNINHHIWHDAVFVDFEEMPWWIRGLINLNKWQVTISRFGTRKMSNLCLMILFNCRLYLLWIVYGEKEGCNYQFSCKKNFRCNNYQLLYRDWECSFSLNLIERIDFVSLSLIYFAIWLLLIYTR